MPFVRLIWRESRFNPSAVSPKGAQGIAQFMPGTAGERGLLDPLNPVQALPKSAEFLAELRSQFGNLGLAAAACAVWSLHARGKRSFLLNRGAAEGRSGGEYQA